MSFIGLYSYYSFDNWGYQPSYVSSNTPWFFNGVRAQWFPTNKLKFEPWLINGWQSYGKFNGRMGVGGQILCPPTTNLDFVWNTYGVGQDTLYTHRTRVHEDDSMEWKYWENPNKLMHRLAFSLTVDVGCETGGGGAPITAGTTQGAKVQCFSNSPTAPAQNFIGAMLYQRFWFDHDKFGATIGGGFMANPGRYLVLLPPINGATATSGTPYFTQNPGQKFSGYDYQLTFDWMPTQFVTWRAEFTERGTNVPYFAGPGGVTPPGGNQGAPGSLVYNPDGSLWTPDLKKQEMRFTFALMVHL
jgi:Putative beta-barrel porin-2, OmpL-like. bbp2